MVKIPTPFLVVPIFFMFLICYGTTGEACTDFSGTYEVGENGGPPSIAKLSQKGCTDLVFEEAGVVDAVKTNGLPVNLKFANQVTQETVWFHSGENLRSILTVLSSEGVAIAMVSSTFRKLGNGEVTRMKRVNPVRAPRKPQTPPAPNPSESPNPPGNRV